MRRRIALGVYGELLDRFPQARCVGSMLRVIDVSRDYPLYNQMMNTRMGWRREPKWLCLSDGRSIAYQHGKIDTTFALHRSGEPFHRMKDSIRVYFPYEARHLDWYQSQAEMVPSRYALSASPDTTHWSKVADGNEALQPADLIYVDYGLDGRLERRVFHVGD